MLNTETLPQEPSTESFPAPDLLPPPGLHYSLPRRLFGQIRDRLTRDNLPPLEITSQPVDLGMLPGDMLELPWYRTVFTNLGNVINPEALPPLQLESRPLDVGELVSDRMGHPWWSSVMGNLRTLLAPVDLPPDLTSLPVSPFERADRLQVPHWSALLTTPKVFLPDEPQTEYAAGAVVRTRPAATPRKPINIDVDFSDLLVSQLKDDLSRSRLREAFWMSLVAHFAVVLVLVFAPKYLPGYKKGVALISAADLMRQRELTYLELPPDLEKNVPKPDTNNISDKNRIAKSRNPVLDRDTLQKLRDARRPGPPAPQSAPSASAPTSPPMAQQQMAQQSPPNASTAPPGQNSPPQFAQLQTPATPANKGNNPFQQALSPGSAIAQAAKASAGVRGFGGSVGGDYGLGSRSTGRIKSNVEVLSDTMGVDFGPYLNHVVQVVRTNWYNIIPEVARPPLLKKGKVTIQFAILKNGSVAGMQLAGSSTDVSLDRAAWGGITASNPFEPLPAQFRGQYLALRFYFFYNPDKNELY